MVQNVFFYFFVASYIHRIEPTNAVLTLFFFVVSLFLYTLLPGGVGSCKAKQAGVGYIELCGFTCLCILCICTLWGSYHGFFFLSFVCVLCSDVYVSLCLRWGRGDGYGVDEGREKEGEFKNFFTSSSILDWMGWVWLIWVWVELKCAFFFFFFFNFLFSFLYDALVILFPLQ